VPLERQWTNVEWAGNQAGSGLLTAFSLGWQAHRNDLVVGDHVLLVAVGAGYTCGGVLLEWRGGGL